MAQISPIEWLLQVNDFGVRYLALRDLVKAGQREINEARKKSHEDGPIARVLAKMASEGYWEKPGSGYFPKYTGTVWSVILLSQLGANIETDNKIDIACNYMLKNTLTENGQFTIDGTPSTTVDCLQGNLCGALIDLGCEVDRLAKAFEWMARSLTGEGIASMGDKTAPLRYYAGKCAPNFACGANNKLPCAWGAVKVMLAFSKLPDGGKTPLIRKAIKQGLEFLFSVDPAKADYPCGYAQKPSSNWWKFGFPVFYVTDLLQNVEALARLGYGRDARLQNAIKIIQEKQDTQGRWLLEYEYTGKTWLDFGSKNQPNKWVTLRALRTLKYASDL